MLLRFLVHGNGDRLDLARMVHALSALTWTAVRDLPAERTIAILPAGAIERKIRAFDPAPGAYTWLDRDRVKLWAANVIEQRSDAAPGTVIATGAEGIDVACGEGMLRIVELQPAGSKRMSSTAFLAGRALPIGSRLLPPSERRA